MLNLPETLPWQVGQYRDALREAETCIALAPAWAKGHTRKGLAHFYLHQYGPAKAAYDKALALDPTNRQLQAKLEVALPSSLMMCPPHCRSVCRALARCCGLPAELACPSPEHVCPYMVIITND